MALVIASAHLDDEQLLNGFESCTLPLSGFRHGDHLRMAWIYLHRNSEEAALKRVRDGILRFAGHYGVAHIYSETMTTAWVKLLATHDEASFAEFVAINELRLNMELLHRFWSPEVLMREAARTSWVAPDRAPLPN